MKKCFTVILIVIITTMYGFSKRSNKIDTKLLATDPPVGTIPPSKVKGIKKRPTITILIRPTQFKLQS